MDFSTPEIIRQMWDHLTWADRKLLKAILSSDGAPDQAVREFAHIIGAEERWLSRIEGREARLPVWPDVTVTQLGSIVRQAHEGWSTFISDLKEEDLDASISYTNSAGADFTNRMGDILLHTALHGQYHRGKINLLLRQAGLEPEPVDFIAFVRGAPAATQASARGSS